MWGYGPWPYFGVYGAVGFGWYGHGWWRTPTRWRYAPGPALPLRPSRTPVARPVAPSAVRAAPPPRSGGGSRRGVARPERR
jgi:hypothetical protein